MYLVAARTTTTTSDQVGAGGAILSVLLMQWPCEAWNVSYSVLCLRL